MTKVGGASKNVLEQTTGVTYHHGPDGFFVGAAGKNLYVGDNKLVESEWFCAFSDKPLTFLFTTVRSFPDQVEGRAGGVDPRAPLPLRLADGGAQGLRRTGMRSLIEFTLL